MGTSGCEITPPPILILSDCSICNILVHLFGINNLRYVHIFGIMSCMVSHIFGTCNYTKFTILSKRLSKQAPMSVVTNFPL